MKNDVRILIAGDLAPTPSNYKLFEDGDIEGLLGREITSIWEEADYRIVNLEAPITDYNQGIKKSGPVLKIPTNCLEGIKKMNISICSLANNHIKDYGEKGLDNTMSLLNSNSIQTIGAGINSREAARPMILEYNDLKMGVYACAEHEYSASDKYTSGANIIGINTALEVNRLKQTTDYVIVLFHGGREHYPYPTPWQKSRCEDLIDAGADIIICQHSHCIGCEQKYKGKTIVYGQGNFLFDYKKISCWDTGLLIDLNIKKTAEGVSASIRYIPICRKENTVRLAKKENRQEILKLFYSRSSHLTDDNEMKRMDAILTEYGKDNLYHYAGFNRLIRGLDKRLLKGFIIRHRYSNKKCRELLGLIQCETHREIMEAWLRKEINEN